MKDFLQVAEKLQLTLAAKGLYEGLVLDEGQRSQLLEGPVSNFGERQLPTAQVIGVLHSADQSPFGHPSHNLRGGCPVKEDCGTKGGLITAWVVR